MSSSSYFRLFGKTVRCKEDDKIKGREGRGERNGWMIHDTIQFLKHCSYKLFWHSDQTIVPAFIRFFNTCARYNEMVDGGGE